MTVTEIQGDGDLPELVHPGWREAYPWLVQGTTTRGSDAEGFDLRLFGEHGSSGAVLGRWEQLRASLGVRATVHARQPHEAAVRLHHGVAPGFHLADPCDGHATSDAGLALTVSVADCVPISVVDPERRCIALLHAGWRGAAAGILERGLAVLGERFGSQPAELVVHLGPSICGACYEVGPEVFEGLGLEVPEGPTPMDLKAALCARALATGVAREALSVSSHCTRCGDAALYSHRGGGGGRQVGFLAIRP